MAPQEYDLIVIGAGPGGYVACVRAAQLGLRVACVERMLSLGGVCLNTGCIPSKALLDSSEFYHLAKSRLAEHGIIAGSVHFDLPTMMARKTQVVKELCDNVRKLLEGNRVEIVQGSARLIGENQVEVNRTLAGEVGGDPLVLSSKSILLATGSETVAVSFLPLDGSRIIGSDEALSLDSVPNHLAIIGGGYIGLELGSVWLRLGSQVTVVEAMPGIAPLLDGQVARTLQRILTRQGFAFRVGTRALGAEVIEDGVRVTLESSAGKEQIHCDRLLVAVGRRPLTRGLGLDEIRVQSDPRTGFILVDEKYRTSVPSIYAIGDLIAGPMLAHKASAEGVAAVECMVGLPGELNYDAIPSIIYTSPEVASVGLTEEQVKARGIKHCIGTYPFAGAGRARCMGETDGFVKVITQSATDRLIGIHIIGPRASDMIAECVLAMEFNATAEDIGRIIHGHPTFSEALHEAALTARKCSIYGP